MAKERYLTNDEFEFQMTYLYLILNHSKDQGQGRAHFRWLMVKIWKTLLLSLNRNSSSRSIRK